MLQGTRNRNIRMPAPCCSLLFISPSKRTRGKERLRNTQFHRFLFPHHFLTPCPYCMSWGGGGVAGVPVASALPAATLCSWALPGLPRRRPFPLGWRGNCAFLPRRMETRRSIPIFTIHSPDPCKEAQLGRCPCPARCLQPSTDGSLWPGGG